MFFFAHYIIVQCFIVLLAFDNNTKYIYFRHKLKVLKYSGILLFVTIGEYRSDVLLHISSVLILQHL